MIDQRLVTLIGALSDPVNRPGVAKKLAQVLGADDLLIFAKDPLLKLLLPAPGFPQTLPDGQSWKEFVLTCQRQRSFAEHLVSPYSRVSSPALGIAAPDDSVFVLLGGSPQLVKAVEISALIPLVVAALFNEQVALIAKGEIEAESLAAERTQTLTHALDLTRRNLEGSLRKTTNILRSITDAFFALDHEWRFTELNPQAEILLQRTQEQLLGNRIWDEFPEGIGSEFDKHYRRAVVNQRPLRFEEFFPLKRAWYEVRGYPSPDGLALYFTDIDERKRAAEDLRESQEWFRTTLHSIGDGVVAVNVDRTIAFLNPVAEELTGWKLSEAKGKLMDEVFQIIHEKTRKPADNPVERVLREGKVVGLANHTALIHRDGKEFIIEDSAAPIKSLSGEVRGVVLVFRDVTADYARKSQLENAIAQRELAIEERDRSLRSLSTVNEVGRQITAELDLEKLVQKVTYAATQLSGAQFGAFFYTAKNEQGESFLLYTISGVPKEAFSKFPQPRNTAVFHPTFMGEGTVRSDDITKDPRYGKNEPHFGMPKGHLPVRSYLAVSVKSRSGEILGGLFFGHEKPNVFNEQSEKIVEGLAAQAAVAMDNARLYHNEKEAVKARDEFLSIASHELKTPLTSLKLQAQMRSRNLNKGDLNAFTPDRLRKMIDADTRQVERLSRLIDDMLDISRISTGKLAIQRERFDLCSFVEDVLERYRNQFQAAGSEVNLKCCDPAVGEWDRFRMEQVLTNLFTNAIRYGASKPVEVSVHATKSHAVLSVRDQGIGIAKENQARIFERFERAITANEVSGLGLGLYIVRQILERHGGTIRVESDLGKGSTFIVELPLSAEGLSDET